MVCQGNGTVVDVASIFEPAVISLQSMQSATLSMVHRVGDATSAVPVNLVPLNITSYFVTLS